MAKVAFTKLGLTKDTSVDEFEWNGQKIEVKQYLPMEEKLKLIDVIINKSVDENGYYNPARVYINTIIEVCFAYSNITITDKQKEDTLKVYDLLVSSGLSGEIIGSHMNPNEYSQIRTWVSEVIHSVYEYRNSVYGILDNLSADYSQLNKDTDQLIEEIKTSDELNMVKDVLTKLG